MRALHAGAVLAGFSLQRLGNELAEKYLAPDLARIREKPANTTGRPNLKGQVIHLVSTPLPGRMPRQTMRAALGIEDEVTIPILRRPDMPADAVDRLLFDLLQAFATPVSLSDVRREKIAGVMARSGAKGAGRTLSREEAAALLAQLADTGSFSFSPSGKAITAEITPEDLRAKLG